MKTNILGYQFVLQKVADGELNVKQKINFSGIKLFSTGYYFVENSQNKKEGQKI